MNVIKAKNFDRKMLEKTWEAFVRKLQVIETFGGSFAQSYSEWFAPCPPSFGFFLNTS